MIVDILTVLFFVAVGLESDGTPRYWLIGNRGNVEGVFFMRVFCAAAVIAMLAGPVYAQSKPKTLEEMMNAKTPDQIEKEQAADRAYKESLKKIPDATAVPTVNHIRPY